MISEFMSKLATGHKQFVEAGGVGGVISDVLHSIKYGLSGAKRLGAAERRGWFDSGMGGFGAPMVGRGQTFKPRVMGTSSAPGKIASDLSNVTPGTGYTPVAFGTAQPKGPRFTRGRVFAGPGGDIDRVKRGAAWGAGLLGAATLFGGAGLGGAVNVGLAGVGLAGVAYSRGRFGTGATVGTALGVAGAYGAARFGEEQMGINPIVAGGAAAGMLFGGGRQAAKAFSAAPRGFKAISSGAGFGWGMIKGPVKTMRAIGETMGVTGRKGGVRGRDVSLGHRLWGTGPKRASTKLGTATGQVAAGVGTVAGLGAGMNLLTTGHVFGSMRSAPAFNEGVDLNFGKGYKGPSLPTSVAHLYGMPY